MLTMRSGQTIAGVAVALKQVSSQAFRDYAAQIIANTKVSGSQSSEP